MTDDRSLLEALLGDGRFLIALTGVSLILSGGFAVFQSISGHLLPHDSHAIGMDAAALMRAGNPHLLGFMFHDRVAYGGSLLAIGSGYLWLAEFPMAVRAAWAWWALLFSGGIGFLAFLTYLGQGYLDTWHGVATLFLLPVFVAGLWRSRPQHLSLRSVWLEPHENETVLARSGRTLLSATALGLILAGATIAIFGMTTVFVPSDLRFIALDTSRLRQISPMLIPVISHDRAGFGGGLCSIGSFLLFTARCAELNRSFIEIVAVMGCTGFGCAIGVHFAVGYLDFFHLLPAFLGLIIFILADSLLWLGRVRAVRMSSHKEAISQQ
ncbi:MAG: hypothetical protein JO061_09430 [Acidobacteriaceae bacterium]|nr:hypothetical protein [Acidobacteriaceae bacterium]